MRKPAAKCVDLDRLSFADPAVFDMITAGDTVGVFQVESRAQSQMLPRFRPTRFEDLVIAISLIRPGPIQGDMVHPFLRRRLGLEEVTYFHDSLKGVLAETLGVILFQEQVLKVAHALAGFTPGQGELLRRALSSKHAPERIASFHDQFIAGALAKGVEQATGRDGLREAAGLRRLLLPQVARGGLRRAGLPIRLAQALPSARLLLRHPE